MKRTILFLFCVIVSLFITSEIKAQVVINEFSSNSDPEWVELYNNGTANIELTGWKLIDEGGGVENLSGTIFIKGYFVYERKKGWLNNTDGDVISLIDASGNSINSVVYGHSGNSITTPSSDKSAGRIPDASDTWQTNLVWTKGINNYQTTSSSDPSPSSSPSQTLTKAVYKINKPKDGFGSELTNVQIYIDGQYVHHLDDEILEFGSGNECYSDVACDYGIHEISLRKDGYISWEDSRDFQDGMDLVVNPVLYIQATNSTTSSTNPTSTPSPTPTKTPTQKPKATTTPTASPSGTLAETLEEKTPVSSPSGQVSGASTEKKDGFPILAIGLVVIGLVFITFAVFSIIKSVKKSYTDGDEGKDS